MSGSGVPTQVQLDELDLRLRTILPEQYQDRYEEVEPVSMGSASLKYGSDGKVAWDEIWGSFCDLAMAGGPPHKGLLLEPASSEQISANPEPYKKVVDEVCRGIRMASDLAVGAPVTPGWVQVFCEDETMAQWLLRAIVMENVSARVDGSTLELPLGPHYRLEKEIKNIITVVAKTVHYWEGHVSEKQAVQISAMFGRLDGEMALLTPALAGDQFQPSLHDRLCRMIADVVHEGTPLRQTGQMCQGWVGFQCPGVRAAVWMARAMIALNVLSRREGTTVFVPVNPNQDPSGAAAGQRLIAAYRQAAARGVLS